MNRCDGGIEAFSLKRYSVIHPELRMMGKAGMYYRISSVLCLAALSPAKPYPWAS